MGVGRLNGSGSSRARFANGRMTAEVQAVLESTGAVVLIEGRRGLPAGLHDQLHAVGTWLARSYPRAIFRSGNAEGSDTAFADGVVSVDPARMQYVLPSPGMGKKRRHPDSPVYSLSDVPKPVIEQLCDRSADATPNNRRLAEAACGRIKSGYLAGRGRYLLRDTLKVVGSASLELRPASLALFYVDLTDTEAGGTGHTIRVCRQDSVPVVFQDRFLAWSSHART